MATNPIYVETEEEIPEVVERLRRFNGEDTMIVLPMRSRIGQSRFNFQLLRNYAARMGKRVTVVCDDPAVQKMASESGFPVFGAVGALGEGIPSEPEAEAPVRRWWQRSRVAPTTHVGIAAPTKLLTRTATELKPGRFLLYITAATLLMVGLFGAAIFVPSADIKLVAQAAPFTQKDVEIQAQPGKPPIRVRSVVVQRSNSQGFKTTGTIVVPLAPAIGQVTYTNKFPPPHCPGTSCGSPGLVVQSGQRLLNTNGLLFAQTSGDVLVRWGQTAPANIQAVVPGTTGNVGSDTITVIQDSRYDPTMFTVTNPQATGGGTDPSNTPQMTVSDFDAGRAQLEQELRQTIAQTLVGGTQAGEKLSETIIFGAPQYSNDQQLLTESPIVVTYRILSATSGGSITFLGNASAFVAPRLDEEKIRSSIVGRPLAQARFYLERLPIRSVAIKEQPLALPLMPLLARRITLHYVIQQGTGTNPAATPSPGATPKTSPSP